MLFTMPSWNLVNPPYKFEWTERTILVIEGSSKTTTEGYMENYKNVLQDIRNQLDVEAEVWKAIERLKQGKSINVQDLKTNLYWEFEKFTSRDGETLKSYYSRGKAIVNSPQPTYDQEPTMVADDDEMSKEKEIEKLMALISLSFKKIYKPTNNNLITSSNTSRANQDNNLRINRGTGYDNQRAVNVAGARENVGDTNITTDSLDMSNNRGEADQDNDDDLSRERNFLASLIEKLKCEIDESKYHNKLLELSRKTLVDKLKSEIKDFKNKNKRLESSKNHFKEANTKLEKNNQLMFKDLKKFQPELDMYHDVMWKLIMKKLNGN
nr:hypothetical protein [Tanacetum cinerariifolium]